MIISQKKKVSLVNSNSFLRPIQQQCEITRIAEILIHCIMWIKLYWFLLWRVPRLRSAWHTSLRDECNGLFSFSSWGKIDSFRIQGLVSFEKNQIIWTVHIFFERKLIVEYNKLPACILIDHSCFANFVWPKLHVAGGKDFPSGLIC